MTTENVIATSTDEPDLFDFYEKEFLAMKQDFYDQIKIKCWLIEFTADEIKEALAEAIGDIK